ncbi:hypothetical protein IVB18_28135 [Bradyrhizobium sp. 186]|uniref:hypothetical protein n=1 Tax=Bradyrhizobium sp. 186 TaxID=2782654 RepID=UPI0020014BAC|nr:hypothetical protein [Bradyrhizobium sp. 186]UPK32161.1 hypothetical protein IVB18_28135 [Bradyrhizobium sp. 186]
MSRKGHYNGGGTLVGRQNTSWFGSTSSKPVKPRIRRPGLAAVQFAEFEKQGIAPSEWAKEQASQIVKKRRRKKTK